MSRKQIDISSFCLCNALSRTSDFDVHCSIVCSGIIHISNMSTARINRVSNVLKVGDQVKMIAVECPTPGKLSFRFADSNHFSVLDLRNSSSST